MVTAVADIIAQGQQDREVRDDIPGEVLAVYLLGLLRTRSNELADSSSEGRSLELALDLFWSGARRPEGATVPASGRSRHVR
jgi:hypothetical protein